MFLKSLTAAAASVLLAGLAHAASISVTYSEDFAEMLDEEYGEREGDVLSGVIIRDIEQALARNEVDATVISIVIEDAKPNRPTLEQLGARPGLDPIRSISIGGMALAGKAFDADGNEIASIEYEWFENNIRDVIGTGTWGDARRASDRFSRRLATALEDA